MVKFDSLPRELTRNLPLLMPHTAHCDTSESYEP